jgi:hypothetical protein
MSKAAVTGIAPPVPAVRQYLDDAATLLRKAHAVADLIWAVRQRAGDTTAPVASWAFTFARQYRVVALVASIHAGRTPA